MLNKLRRRFIMDTMIVAVAVLVVSILLLFLAFYTYSKNSADDRMSAALQGLTELTVHTVPSEDGTKGGVQIDEDALTYTDGTTILILSPKGDLLFSGSDPKRMAEVLEQDLPRIARAVLAEENDTGIIASAGQEEYQSLRYKKAAIPTVGTKVALLDRTEELQQMNFQIRMYVVLMFIILIVIYVLCDFMARRSIVPVDEAIRAQQQFIADASHELKTPITVILANLDIIGASPDTTVKESEKWLENTKSEAKRMWKLVNEMLFLARSDAAMDMNYNFRLLDFSELVDEVVLATEALAFERNITFVDDIAEHSQVVGDAERLKQLVMILVENAFKYVDENGTITVKLTTSPFRSEILSVTNTGAPIPEEKAAHVFDRFYRVEESRVRETGGYGLGLSIATKIVERHNGDISLAYSNEEQGTCFEVRLPNAQNLKAPDLSAPPKEEAEQDQPKEQTT